MRMPFLSRNVIMYVAQDIGGCAFQHTAGRIVRVGGVLFRQVGRAFVRQIRECVTLPDGVRVSRLLERP